MSQLELGARPLRRDASRLVVPLLILPGLVFALAQAPVTAVLCPLLLGPWLWWRRERFWLDRCRVLVDGATLLIYYRQRQLMALDLRYASRQFTGAGDLVLSEGDASYLALGVDPPEHAYPDSADLPENSSSVDLGGSASAVPPAATRLPSPDRAGPDGPLVGTWRAVRLLPADLRRLTDHLAQVPLRPPPDSADPWSLLQALGSAGVTGQKVEPQLARLAHADHAQTRPSGLLTTLRERALEPGPVGDAARRVLKVP